MGGYLPHFLFVLPCLQKMISPAVYYFSSTLTFIYVSASGVFFLMYRKKAAPIQHMWLAGWLARL